LGTRANGGKGSKKETRQRVSEKKLTRIRFGRPWSAMDDPIKMQKGTKGGLKGPRPALKGKKRVRGEKERIRFIPRGVSADVKLDSKRKKRFKLGREPPWTERRAGEEIIKANSAIKKVSGGWIIACCGRHWRYRRETKAAESDREKDSDQGKKGKRWKNIRL